MTSPSPAPLTEAEQLAYVEIYTAKHDTQLPLLRMREGASCEECQTAARAVVAAVEPHHTIAALERAATALDELAAVNARAGRGTAEGPWIAAGVQGAALNVRRQTRELQSLSLPASKETP